MAVKKRKKVKTLTKRQKALQNVRLGKLYAERRRKTSNQIKNKLRLYNGLVNSFIEKQIQLGNYTAGEKGLKKKARESIEMKQIVKDLKSKDPFLKLHALKQTTRRDNVPDTIPVGETPAVYSEAA
jgi:hypothetical protein